MNYKVINHRRGTRYESDGMTLAMANAYASKVKKGSKVVTILKRSDGSDHPANAGKWFLHQIVK